MQGGKKSAAHISFEKSWVIDMQSRHGSTACAWRRRPLAMLVGWTLLLISMSVSTGAAEPAANWPPTDPQELLEQLRAKDAEFADVLLELERREMIHRDLERERADRAWNNFRFGGRADAAEPILDVRYGDPYDVERVSKEKFLIRGDEMCLDVSNNPDCRGNWVHELKLTNAGGVQKELSKTNGGTYFHKDTARDLRQSYFYGYQKLTKLALGVGYGELMQKIDRITPCGDTIKIEATMQVWGDDATTARLTLDRDLIVRYAILSVDYDRSGLAQMELSTMTEGKCEGTRPSCVAKSGQLIHARVVSRVDGEIKKGYSVQEEFQITASRLQNRPGDAVFNAMVDFGEPKK